MNFYSQVKDHIWVSAGCVAGLTAGMSANLLRSGSLLGKSYSVCSNAFNGLFNPSIPFIHTVPMLASSLWNTFNPNPSQKGKSLLNRGWQNLSTQVINPLIHQNVLLGGSLLARHLLSSASINPSGHVIFHAANTLNAIKSLEGLSHTESPKQKKIYSILNIGIALTDAAWLYNSAANCHSVTDIASGVACVAIGLFGLETGKIIINKGYNLIKNRFFSITKTELEIKQTPKEMVSISAIPSKPLAKNVSTGRSRKSPKEEAESHEAEQLIKTANEVISTISKTKITSFLKEYSWVAAGSLIGFTLGVASNLIQRGSIFEKDFYKCRNYPFGGFIPFIKINDLRENRLKMLGDEAFLILMNPYCPLIHLFPQFVCAIWNAVMKKTHSKNDVKTIASRGCEYLFKNVMIPSVHSILLCAGSRTLRDMFDRHGTPKLDTSGHLIVQIAHNFFIMKSLKGLAETGTHLQNKTFTRLYVIFAVTDAIWVFNTVSNCHAVVDAIAALACSSIAYVGIESCKFLLNKGYDWGKHKISKILGKAPVNPINYNQQLD